MSNYKNACPPEYYDDDNGEDYNSFVQQSSRSSQSASKDMQQQQKNFGIKIIPRLGVEAGLNKSDFDIQLDANAQKWFDQIFQYWRQCESRFLNFFKN